MQSSQFSPLNSGFLDMALVLILSASPNWSILSKLSPRTSNDPTVDALSATAELLKATCLFLVLYINQVKLTCSIEQKQLWFSNTSKAASIAISRSSGPLPLHWRVSRNCSIVYLLSLMMGLINFFGRFLFSVLFIRNRSRQLQEPSKFRIQQGIFGLPRQFWERLLHILELKVL